MQTKVYCQFYAQCGNVENCLPLRFYVKAILAEYTNFRFYYNVTISKD